MTQTANILFNRILLFFQFGFNSMLMHLPKIQAKDEIINSIKENLTCYKKIKVAKYRVLYAKYKVQEFEKLIKDANKKKNITGYELDEKR